MKPEEEADRIIEMFGNEVDSYGEYMNATTQYQISKQCAILHVDGIMTAFANPKNVSYKQSVEKIEAIKSINQVNYNHWQEVKTILENR